MLVFKNWIAGFQGSLWAAVLHDHMTSKKIVNLFDLGLSQTMCSLRAMVPWNHDKSLALVPHMPAIHSAQPRCKGSLRFLCTVFPAFDRKVNAYYSLTMWKCSLMSRKPSLNGLKKWVKEKLSSRRWMSWNVMRVSVRVRWGDVATDEAALSAQRRNGPLLVRGEKCGVGRRQAR